MTTALYRRYRPDTFDDVIGQEHVTDALKTALSTSRVAHAFLFSGPRGCGKTTSARILARSLNCEKGPTATPCGECPSCRDLAAGGPGSLDVVEIDAASHSGVDEARELRDRVTFAPTRDRYRIFILDEAHMVTPAGFNALLKVVEEPPEHVKFIFATTEPEKVISTIKSRTHHYPFRLVGPSALKPLLQQLAEKEGIEIDEGVYPLLIRAGGGSVRDSLSAMDQLMAGADGHVTTDDAVRLLGYTDSNLLDRTVEALGDGDGAKAFAVVDEIIEAGHEPRQFTMDLLQRLRDMMVCALAGERAADILVEIPSDVLELLHIHAQKWGPRALSARADRVEAALREMTVASAPRMQLELLLARLLVDGDESAPPAVAGTPATARPTAARPPVSELPPVRTSQPATNVGGRPGSALPAEHTPIQPDPTEQGVSADVPPGVAPKAQSGIPNARSDASTAQGDAPTKEQVRGQWRALLGELGQYGSIYAPLLQSDVRDVVSRGSVVHFFLLSETNVKRLRKHGGEEHLGQALSALFGGKIESRVHAWADLETFEQDGQAPASTAHSDGAAQQVNTSVPEEASELRSVVEPDEADLPGTASPEEDVPPVQSPPEQSATDPAGLEVPTQTVVQPETATTSDAVVPPAAAPPAANLPPETNAEPPAPTDEQPNVWRGRPAADVVLGVLGGQVVEEEIVSNDQ